MSTFDPEALFDEKAVESWKDFLHQFNDQIMPMYRRFGITDIGTALVIWNLNRIYNSVIDVESALLGGPSEGEEWKS